MQGKIVSYAQHELTETEAKVSISIMEMVVDDGVNRWSPEQVAFAEDWLRTARLSPLPRERVSF